MKDDAQLLLDAADGCRGDVQQTIAETVIEWGALLLRKNADYGCAVWKTPKLAPECSPGVAIRVRMSDKLDRLLTLLSSENPAQVKGESIDDTLKDFAAYALLELARKKYEAAKTYSPKLETKDEPGYGKLDRRSSED